MNKSLLLFPLLFVGGCEARNATAIQSSHPEINTFFGTTSLSERSRPYSRFNTDKKCPCQFFSKHEKVAIVILDSIEIKER